MNTEKLLENLKKNAEDNALHGRYGAMQSAIERYDMMIQSQNQRGASETLVRAYRETEVKAQEDMFAIRSARSITGSGVDLAKDFIINGDFMVIDRSMLEELQLQLSRLGYKVSYA